MLQPGAPRWPSVRAGRGHYESFYLRAAHPTEPRGLWIRYTVTLPPGGRPTGQLWCTYFARPAPPRAVRVDCGEPASDEGTGIRLGDANFGAATATGGAVADRASACWDLRWRSAEQPLMHLPREWMYTARLPRTKLVSLRPTAVFEGTLEIDGETVDISGWPGMTGHNWGEQHAERWIWLSGVAFDRRGPATWLDVALARIRLGPLLSPWIATGAVSLDGRRFRLGGPGRRVPVLAEDDRCSLRIPGSGARVDVSASAPADAFAEWDYADPDGRPRRVRNCSVADISVAVGLPQREEIELIGDGRAAYELGGPMTG